MQLYAIGFELRFVGNRPDEGMTKRKLGERPVSHLIDQFCGDQRCSSGSSTK